MIYDNLTQEQKLNLLIDLEQILTENIWKSGNLVELMLDRLHRKGYPRSSNQLYKALISSMLLGLNRGVEIGLSYEKS